ncbi:DUF7848 domain-containing protein [Streptomyces sp. NPDC002537]
MLRVTSWVLGFVDRRLQGERSAGPAAATMVCASCGSSSAISEFPGDPRGWALGHAGRTGHMQYTSVRTRPFWVTAQGAQP